MTPMINRGREFESGRLELLFRTRYLTWSMGQGVREANISRFDSKKVGEGWGHGRTLLAMKNYGHARFSTKKGGVMERNGVLKKIIIKFTRKVSNLHI